MKPDQPKPATETREAGCTCGDAWPCPLHGGPPEQPRPNPASGCEGCGGDRFIETTHTLVCKRCGLTQPKPATGEGITEEKRLRIRLAQVEQQLAAEREAHAATEKQLSLNATEYMTLGSQLAAEHENLMKLERDWHKVINEVLKCDPIPARDRSDDQLEPPWEVIARIRQQLAAEREKRQLWEKQDGLQIKQLRQQLAAERKTVKEYEDYIKSLDRIAGIETE